MVEAFRVHPEDAAPVNRRRSVAKLSWRIGDTGLLVLSGACPDPLHVVVPFWCPPELKAERQVGMIWPGVRQSHSAMPNAEAASEFRWDSGRKSKRHADRSRPLGSGIGRPNSLAVSIHSWITISAFASASCRTGPSAAHPGNSGTSAMNASSSAFQYKMISYFVIRPPR